MRIQFPENHTLLLCDGKWLVLTVERRIYTDFQVNTSSTHPDPRAKNHHTSAISQIYSYQFNHKQSKFFDHPYNLPS